jgi:hypothetical protein
MSLVRSVYAFVVTLIAVLLTACESNLPSPTPDYASTVPSDSSGRCPDISGIYLNDAKSSQCSEADWLACQSLSFYLLSAHVSEAYYPGIYLPTPQDDWPAEASFVSIEQPSDNVIRVLVGETRDKLTLARELRADRDEFRCTPNRVALKPRLESKFLFAFEMTGRGTRREDRSLMRARDGGLTVSSHRVLSSYWLGIVPWAEREVSTVITWPLADTR